MSDEDKELIEEMDRAIKDGDDTIEEMRIYVSIFPAMSFIIFPLWFVLFLALSLLKLIRKYGV